MNQEYVDFLYNLGIRNIKLGLNNTRNLLKEMDNPQNHPRIIHFAGTNGKGSTLATLEALLIKSGFTTGSTVSPHLISFNERFRINGQSVSEKDVDQAFINVCKACEIDHLNLPGYQNDAKVNPTFFEFAIAMAFEIFRQYKVDYILLETGLGGRLDATNVVENPIANVLTRIDFDHQDFLGDTIEEIASEKLGIVKPNVPVFVANQRADVSALISEFLKKSKNPHDLYPQQFRYISEGEKTIFEVQPSCSCDSTCSITVNQMGLSGEHQKENTATALAVYLHTVPPEKRLSDAEIAKIIQEMRWPGRLQFLGKEKKVLIDGAHNLSGMASFIQFVEKNYHHSKILFAISWLDGKNIIPAIKNSSLENVDFFPLEMKMTTVEQKKAIKDILKKEDLKSYPLKSVTDFYNTDLPELYSKYDLILVAGSLYLLGDFLALWNAQPVDSSV